MKPLYLAGRELTAAWDAAHAMQRARSLDELVTAWASAIGHFEKLWVKTGQACAQARPGFQKWNRPWDEIRKSDALLRYMTQARHVDNHLSQDLASFLSGQLEWNEHGLKFTLYKNPGPVINDITNRGVLYVYPDTHLGQPLKSRDPRALVVLGCNFYAHYLRQVRVGFLGLRS